MRITRLSSGPHAKHAGSRDHTGVDNTEFLQFTITTAASMVLENSEHGSVFEAKVSVSAEYLFNFYIFFFIYFNHFIHFLVPVSSAENFLL